MPYTMGKPVNYNSVYKKKLNDTSGLSAYTRPSQPSITEEASPKETPFK